MLMCDEHYLEQKIFFGFSFIVTNHKQVTSVTIGTMIAISKEDIAEIGPSSNDEIQLVPVNRSWVSP